MSIWLSLINDGAVSIFGSVLSASFCNTLHTRKNRRVFWCSMAALLLLQCMIYSVWDAEFMRKMYPLVVHLPLFLLLYGMTRKVLWPVISVLTAYLCCQLRRWIALFTVALISGDAMTQDIVELIVTVRGDLQFPCKGGKLYFKDLFLRMSIWDVFGTIQDTSPRF